MMETDFDLGVKFSVTLEEILACKDFNIMESLRDAVYKSGIPMKVIAEELDMTPSEFSKKLNETDNCSFHLKDFFRILIIINDPKPLEQLLIAYFVLPKLNKLTENLKNGKEE